MKKFILAAAATMALAAPVFAQSHAEFAIMHFNMDADSTGDIRMSSGEIMVIDPNDNEALAAALANFNMSADSVGDLRGLGGVTVIVNGHSDRANEIFMRLMDENMGDE